MTSGALVDNISLEKPNLTFFASISQSDQGHRRLFFHPFFHFFKEGRRKIQPNLEKMCEQSIYGRLAELRIYSSYL